MTNWLRKGYRYYRIPFVKPCGKLAADKLLSKTCPSFLIVNYKPARFRKTTGTGQNLRVGLLVNLEIIPKQKITHLKIDWDFRCAWTYPAVKPIRSVQACIGIALKKAPLHLLESLRGKFVAMEKQVHLGHINFSLF